MFLQQKLQHAESFAQLNIFMENFNNEQINEL